MSGTSRKRPRMGTARENEPLDIAAAGELDEWMCAPRRPQSLKHGPSLIFSIRWALAQGICANAC